MPWYTARVLAGLRDAHLVRGNQPALEVLLVNFASWIDTACAGVSLEQFQKMLDREHGGMNEYWQTCPRSPGRCVSAELGQRFSHHASERTLGQA